MYIKKLYKMLKLMVDDREQAVIPYFKNNYSNVTVEIKRMHIGDYSIIKNQKILFCIERKTWKDLSASIRDGRDDNINKMIELRKQTNCKLLLLIEGKSRYSPDRKIGRIPYKNLQAKLDHLIVRDDIHIIYSQSCEDTTDRLIEFCSNYITLGNDCKSLLENTIVVPGDKIVVGDGDFDGGKHSAVETLEESSSVGNQVDILTTVIKKSDTQVIKNMWCCLPQISANTSNVFILGDIHIADFLAGKIKSSDIENMKYDNGVAIGPKRAAKICKLFQKTSKTSKSNNSDAESDDENNKNYKHYCNVLAEIPGITKKTASIILLETTFEDILNGSFSIEQLANIQKTPKSKLGKSAAGNIYKYLVKQN